MATQTVYLLLPSMRDPGLSGSVPRGFYFRTKELQSVQGGTVGLASWVPT